MEMRAEEKKKHHFVLVHGACHGSWCWYKLVTLLRLAGHKVTAPDLAGAGIHSNRLHEINSISDYFQPLMEVMTSLPLDEKVILVGHGKGGVSISVAMEKFPHKISAAVFVSALMPGPNFTLPTLNQEFHKRVDSLVDSQHLSTEGQHNPPPAILFGPEFLSSKLYHLCSPEDVTLATMLVRPTNLHHDPDVLKETAVSKQNYGSVSRIFIMCGDNKALDEDYQRWMIQNNPVKEVKVLPASGHMVMLSKPMELRTCFLDIADRYS